MPKFTDRRSRASPLIMDDGFIPSVKMVGKVCKPSRGTAFRPGNTQLLFLSKADAKKLGGRPGPNMRLCLGVGEAASRVVPVSSPEEATSVARCFAECVRGDLSKGKSCSIKVHRGECPSTRKEKSLGSFGQPPRSRPPRSRPPRSRALDLGVRRPARWVVKVKSGSSWRAEGGPMTFEEARRRMLVAKGSGRTTRLELAPGKK